MASVTKRSSVKAKFETGDTPTQADFAELIDNIGGELNASNDYEVGDEVTFGTGKYLCTSNASAGQTPATHPAKWKKIAEGLPSVVFGALTQVSSTNDFAATITGETAYRTNCLYHFVVPSGKTDESGDVRVNVNAIGWKVVKTKDGIKLPVELLKDLEVVSAIYNGTDFILQNKDIKGLSKTTRVTPTEFATLNSSPIQAVTGVAGYACLFITGTAIPYTGTTPYNEGNSLSVVDDVNFNDQGLTVNITNTGRSAIITQQQTADCLSDGNGLLLTMGNDLTGGDIGYDVTLFYSFIPVS